MQSISRTPTKVIPLIRVAHLRQETGSATTESRLFRGKLVVQSTGRVDLIPVEQILMCEASDNYCTIHTGDGRKYTLSKTLKWVEQALQSDDFYRVHQSYLIHLDGLEGIDKGRHRALLRGGIDVPISRSKRTEIQNLLTATLS